MMLFGTNTPAPPPSPKGLSPRICISCYACFRIHQTHKRVQRGTQESSLYFTGEILPKRKAPNKIVKNEVTLKPSIAKSERKKKYQLPYSYIWFFGVYPSI
jgi:hypothetical protein